MSVIEENTIPEHWRWVTLSDVGEWTGGGTPSKRKQSYWEGGTIPWVSPKDMKVGEIHETEDYVTETAVDESSAKLIPAGSVLFVTRSGILRRTLPTAIAKVDVTINQDLKAFTPTAGVDSKFVFYYTLAQNRDILRQCSKDGTTVQSIKSASLYDYPFPLPPIAEQHRIVEKIEELFSELDAGVASLKKVQKQLQRYRQSVLQAAVEGRLTEEWRKQQEDLEPAHTLLERISESHRNQWEKEYKWRRYDARGKEPPSGWKSRYDRPDSIEDDSELFTLPSSWTWVRAEQICGFITKGTTPKADKMNVGSGEVPFIKVYNLTNRGILDFSIDPTFVDRQTHEGKLARSRLLPGDVLMNIVGPPLGQVSVVPDDYPEWNMNQAVVRYRPLPGVSRQYLTYVLRTNSILSWAIRKRKATAGQFNLTLAICRDLPIPLPPLAEQHQIVAGVERLLSVADVAEKTVERERKRAERLRQSILKHAFSGRLISSPDTEVEGQSYGIAIPQ